MAHQGEKYEPDGTDWGHHGNRGNDGANAIPGAVREQVVQLASGKYAWFNDTHLHYKLTVAEGLKIGRQSVRRILRAAGIASPQKHRAPLQFALTQYHPPGF